jgi:hypothetical protein
MPLYEVLLRTEGREEIRLTDRAYTVGQTLMIGNRTWVVSEVRPGTERSPRRFVAEPMTAPVADLKLASY